MQPCLILHFLNLFTIQLTFLLYFPCLFTIQLTFLPYFSYLFTIQLAFLPYCPYLITIRLIYSDFSVKFSFQPIYTDYANWAYFDKRSHLNLLLWNRWTKLKQIWLGWSYGRYCIKFPQNRMKGVLWNDCVEILCQQISSYGFREKFNGKSIWLFRPIYMFSTSGVTWVVSQEILMYMD